MYRRAVEYLRSKKESDFVSDDVVDVVRTSKTAEGGSKAAFPVRGEQGKIALILIRKRPDADEIRDLLTEAAMQVVLHHKLTNFLNKLAPEKRRHYARIPEVYTVARDNREGIVIVTERVDEMLDEYLERSPSDQIFCLCLYQVTRTIAWLRKKFNFIHGDLKMNNVAVERTPSECPPVQSYIIDFGMSSFESVRDNVRVAKQALYIDTSRSKNAHGVHSHNDILFFLLSTWKLWKDVIQAYNEPKARSFLKMYTKYLTSTLFKDVRAKVKSRDVRDPLYAIYNKNTAGDFDDSVGIDLVRMILQDFKANHCVQKILRPKE